WKRLERMRDADIRRATKSDPDAAPVASPAWLRRAKLLEPQPKLPVSMRLDEDILKWFRARGRGYQTRINAVLRAYIEAHRSR
ncbi:MAG TPA: BrnA antitoxin family protein, partial [Candidatus Solibacter sp.]|nr:BrnA antitoxin family protein [Candidatus Solibacter sp.]